MAIEAHYDRENRILHVTVRGAPTLDDARATMVEITSSDSFPPHTDALWDLREMDLTNLSSAFLQRVIDLRKQHPQRFGARLACVVTGDFAFGMFRMYEMLSDTLPGRVMVFRDYAEAEQWLLAGGE